MNALYRASYPKNLDSSGPFLYIVAHCSGHHIHFSVKECNRFEVVKGKQELANGREDTLVFLKGGTRVNRELLTNKLNQLRRGMSSIESVDCLQKAGEG